VPGHPRPSATPTATTPEPKNTRPAEVWSQEISVKETENTPQRQRDRNGHRHDGSQRQRAQSAAAAQPRPPPSAPRPTPDHLSRHRHRALHRSRRPPTHHNQPAQIRHPYHAGQGRRQGVEFTAGQLLGCARRARRRRGRSRQPCGLPR
jgi:hypothetical protein